MKPIYSVGDIHGQAAMLDQVLAKIEADGGHDATVVFLGDYTDRGPDSRAVVDQLIAGREAGRDWVFLKGNHDRMFEWFMQVPTRFDPYMFIDLSWLNSRLGGDTTLMSYGLDFSTRRRFMDVHAEALAAVPQSHVDFLNSLQLTYETDDLFFCHAGVRPDVPLDAQDEHDLLWIREEFHMHTLPHPKLIVHGHTPIDTPTHYGNRVNLDTGAGYSKPLSVAVFEGGEVWELGDEGRKELSAPPQI